MDDDRFDAFMRVVARTSRRASRRQIVLALIASGVAMLAAPRGVARSAGQEAGVSSAGTCRQDSDCTTDGDPCTGAHCDAGSCAYTIVACLPDHICCGNGECCLAGDDTTNPGESDDPEGEGAPDTGAATCATDHESE